MKKKFRWGRNRMGFFAFMVAGLRLLFWRRRWLRYHTSLFFIIKNIHFAYLYDATCDNVSNVQRTKKGAWMNIDIEMRIVIYGGGGRGEEKEKKIVFKKPTRIHTPEEQYEVFFVRLIMQMSGGYRLEKIF